MFMMTSQILEFADSWKTQKSKYLKNKTQFFRLVKKFTSCTSKGYIIAKNSFLAKVTILQFTDTHNYY